jgi:hypothetical protein
MCERGCLACLERWAGEVMATLTGYHRSSDSWYWWKAKAGGTRR